MCVCAMCERCVCVCVCCVSAMCEHCVCVCAVRVLCVSAVCVCVCCASAMCERCVCVCVLCECCVCVCHMHNMLLLQIATPYVHFMRQIDNMCNKWMTAHQ